MSDAKQRWRLVFARGEEARYLSHLDAVHLWERAFRRGEIPVAHSEGFSPRPRLIFAAPLPLGMLAEHELADLFLSERLTRPDLRSRLAAGMPSGYRLIDLYDEWVGGPALATQLVAADYRLGLLGAEGTKVEAAIGELLAAEALPRERRREKKVTRYDLRPLLVDLRLGSGREADEAATPLWMRLRHSQDGGSGRPEEVVAEMASRLGLAFVSLDRPDGDDETRSDEPDSVASQDRERTLTDGPTAGLPASAPALEMVAPVRERLWLRDELVVD